jgi:uncharacterized protein (DUF952 family)
MLYHILKAQDWEHVQTQKVYVPETFAQEGFIHLCKADQFEGVVNRYFYGQGDLVALCIAPEALIAELRYENLFAGKELFPHLYGPLNLDAVRDLICFRSRQSRTSRPFTIESIKSQISD